MNAPIFILMTLVAAAAIALVIFLGALLLATPRQALRLAGAGMMGAGIGFAGTGMAMAPFHPNALVNGEAAYAYFGSAVLAGLAGGLLCAGMIYRLPKRTIAPPGPTPPDPS